MIRKNLPSPEAPEFEIRSGYPKDAEKIFEVQKETWIATYANEEFGITTESIAERFDLDRETILDLWRRRLEKGHQAERIWVAVVSDEIIGFCSAHNGINENQIGDLYVLPKRQAQGIGENLLKEALLWLGDDKPIVLGVVKYNASAIKFYKKHGFVDGPDVSEQKCIQMNGKIIPEMEMIKKFE